jgi:hypothetical protein
VILEFGILYAGWVLRPHDFLVALHRLVYPERLTVAQIAAGLCVGVSTAHRGLIGAKAASLITASGAPNHRNILEFTLHGARYAFYPVFCGGNSRGVPTAGAAPELAARLVGSAMIVWPDPRGTLRGEGLEPIHPRAVQIAAADPKFYTLLASIDLLRVGGAREREVAAAVLRERLEAGR